MSHPSLTYRNPVYNHGFPDPFVLKYCGEYWAYCTGRWNDGRCFGVLRSRDLVHWQALGGAMQPLAEEHPHYWAPEVTYHNGRFYLYYSAGDEEHMQIRVAVAVHPAGPFVDSGRRLTSEKFAIDGHVFIDRDGAWHLFYATDFLDREHVGTGTVRDRLLDPYTLAGRPMAVTLPRYDWHIYDPQRAEKGGVRWHTIEGPFVLEHKGRYYQMFSGGNWQNLSYGVSYAVADRVETHGEWEQVADGERVLPVLRTIPGMLIGPGHNSVVRGPDNRQLYCIYHCWAKDSSARVLAIDPLDWAGERLLVLGPSTTPQLAPTQPTFADFFDRDRAEGLGPGWECTGGRWSTKDGAAVQGLADGVATAYCQATASCFLAEVSVRALDASGSGSYGIGLEGDLKFFINPSEGQIKADVYWGDYGWEEEVLPLPKDFDARCYHLLRIEVSQWNVWITLDNGAVRWDTSLLGSAGRITLQTNGMPTAFSAFAMTTGWEDQFIRSAQADPVWLGWRTEGQRPGRDEYRPRDQPAKSLRAYGWSIAEQHLWHTSYAADAFITKDAPLDSYEFVVSARLDRKLEPHGCYGFYPTVSSFYEFYTNRQATRGPLLTVESDGDGWALVCRGAATRTFRLPDFDATGFQQFRFRKQGRRLAIQWEAQYLGEIDVPPEPAQVGLYAHQALVAFDMVRVTVIPA